MKRIFFDLYTIDLESFRKRVIDVGLLPDTEYVIEVFVLPSEWYREKYNFKDELIEKTNFRVDVLDLEYRYHFIKELYKYIMQSTSLLDAGRAIVPINGKRTWCEATIFIRIHKWQ